ncbi:MAG: hypothetical protein QW838_02925 [Candidatus Nitrosotenuis sp.]
MKRCVPLEYERNREIFDVSPYAWFDTIIDLPIGPKRFIRVDLFKFGNAFERHEQFMCELRVWKIQPDRTTVPTTTAFRFNGIYIIPLAKRLVLLARRLERYLQGEVNKMKTPYEHTSRRLLVRRFGKDQGAHLVLSPYSAAERLDSGPLSTPQRHS